MSTSRPLPWASAGVRRGRLVCLGVVLAGLTALPTLGERLSCPTASAQTTPGHLTSRPAAAAPADKPLAVGDTITTRAGERRRATLPDGSVLYVNAGSRVKLDAAGSLNLTRGEVHIELAPRGKGAGEFEIDIGADKVCCATGHLVVQANKAGPGVAVLRGKATFSRSGEIRTLEAGEQLPPGAATPTGLPLASHLLDWTRELKAAAEPRLVPGSEHAGGALVARDPAGQEAKLTLRRYHVDVHVEDGFARTTIDQTYFNHENAQLEGTFYFPLPPDASLSRLAMYVGENLMEGGMAERDHARTVYETIRYTQRDPALLEWVDGSTFKMRVFPLEPRQEKRLLLSYTQKLPSLYGTTQYRFPAGHSLSAVKDWSFHARVKYGAGRFDWASASHTLTPGKEGPDLLLDAAAKDVTVDRDVVLSLTDRKAAKDASPAAAFAEAEHEGARYLMVRYRPQLDGPAKWQRRDWVFLVETSGDRDPLLARVQIDVLRHLLTHAEPDDTFAVLTAGARTRALAARPQWVTPENVKAAVKFLEGAHLVGALDLGKALADAAPLLQAGKNPVLVHLGSGVAAMGERREDVLSRRLPDGARYVGVGVGRRWARTFMKATAERTGGYFTQINPDETIGWRAFELFAALNTPRLMDASVTDDGEKATFRNVTNAVAQGEELCAIARLPKDAEVPKSLTVSGLVDGKRVSFKVAVKAAPPVAGYLPRTWARLEIDRLLAEDAVKHKGAIVGLSKAMYVMTPFTSLLVLETEEMYKQFNVDRGRKDHWAMYPAPVKIKVVHEPDPNAPDPTKKTAQQVRATVLVRVPPEVVAWSETSAGVRGPRLPVDVTMIPELRSVILPEGSVPVRRPPEKRDVRMWFSGGLPPAEEKAPVPMAASLEPLGVVVVRGVDPRLVQEALDAINGRKADGKEPSEADDGLKYRQVAPGRNLEWHTVR